MKRKPNKGNIKNSTLVLFFVFLFAVAAVFMFFFNSSDKKGETVAIYLDGKIYKTVELSILSESYIIDVEGLCTVLIEDGEVRMLSSSCPDKLCVKMGKLTKTSPVICLPNRVEISYIDSDFDVVVG